MSKITKRYEASAFQAKLLQGGDDIDTQESDFINEDHASREGPVKNVLLNKGVCRCSSHTNVPSGSVTQGDRRRDLSTLLEGRLDRSKTLFCRFPQALRHTSTPRQQRVRRFSV